MTNEQTTKGNETMNKRNIVIKTKRESFMYDNAMQYIAVDSDTGEILGEAHWDKSYSCYELNVDGQDLDVEELCDARFGHRKDAFQKDAPSNIKHPNFIGMTNPAYTTRHYYTEWMQFQPTVKSIKTLLVELTQNKQKVKKEMTNETIQRIIQNTSKEINFVTKVIVEAVNEIVMLEMEQEITELEEGKLKNLYLKKERKERELQLHASDISNLLKLLKKA